MLIRRTIQNSDSCEHVFKYISTADFPPKQNSQKTDAAKGNDFHRVKLIIKSG